MTMMPPPRPRFDRRASLGGFTLIEMLVVVAIMAAVLAMAAPRLLPTLVYSTHEGAARRLANYGRAAMAHATLDREAITIKIDFNEQEYWAERLPDPPEKEEDVMHEALQEDDGLPKEDDDLFAQAREELALPKNQRGSEKGDSLLAKQSLRMTERLNDRSQRSLQSQANRVKQDERFVQDPSESAREKVFGDAAGEEALDAEPVDDPLLGRVALPDDVRITLVEIGSMRFNEGVAEIELSPTGLDAEANFWLMNDDGDVYVVRWDPVTGRASVHEDTGA